MQAQKKQELAELDAMLAELGVEDSDAKDSPQPDDAAALSSKAAKRRNKKERGAQNGESEAGEAAVEAKPESSEATVSVPGRCCAGPGGGWEAEMAGARGGTMAQPAGKLWSGGCAHAGMP